MDKVYVITVDEWFDDHINSCLAGVYSSLDKANDLKDKLIPVLKRREEDGENDGFDIDVRQETIDTPNEWTTLLLTDHRFV